MATATARPVTRDNGDHIVGSKGAIVRKTERYGWQLVDEQGAFEWIDKHRLHISPEYQRDQYQSKVLAMAKRWSWVACGSLTVALRPDGSLFVMDGGHRAIAALKREDIKELPCMIYEARTVEDEARGFLESNTLRRPVETVDKFRAMVRLDDKAAVHLQSLCDAAGYKIRKNGEGRTLRCINAALKCYRAWPDVFDRCWPLIVEAAAGDAITHRVVECIVYIESRLEDATLTRQPWRDRVVRLGNAGIVEAAAKASAMYARGGAAVWSKGVMAALNSGVRNRIALKGQKADE